MKLTKAVAFDGTPVHGGAGIRTPILDVGGCLTVRDGRRLTSTELDKLVEGGYVTRLDPPLKAETDEVVVVYRHTNFAFDGFRIEPATQWSWRAGIEVVLTAPKAAARLLQRYAGTAFIAAQAALTKRDLGLARDLARRGLMVVPHLRESPAAAQLYGVLAAIELLQGQPPLARKELSVMLRPDLVQRATEVMVAALFHPRRSPADGRRTDRLLVVGEPRAPREVAA